jgi:hypothetical protein
MGRWRIGIRFPVAALAAWGAFALLAGCGSSNHANTCATIPPGPSGDAGLDAGGSGMLVIGGMVTNCPIADSLTISPNELDVGQGGTSTLSVTASVPDEGMPTFVWTAPSGIFGSPDAPTTTFQCTVAGDINITVTVSYDGCQNQLSGIVTCLAPDGG